MTCNLNPMIAREGKNCLDGRWESECSNLDHVEVDRILSPIEEESESAVSSRETTEFSASEPEEGNYRIGATPPDGYREAFRDLEGNRKQFTNGNELPFAGNSNSMLEKRTANSRCEGNVCVERSTQDNSWWAERRMCERSKTEREASGDSGMHLYDLKVSVECLKGKVSEAEKEIFALKKYLSLDKLQNRKFVLKCHESCTRSQEMLKNDMKIWKSGIEERIRVEERSTKKIYENIQKHFDMLDMRNKKSYLSFRMQIDMWEKRLRDEIVDLHEKNMKDIRQQLKPWGFDRNHSADRTSVQEEILLKIRESNLREIRRIEQTLKNEIQEQRDNLTKRINDEVTGLRIAFDEFRHSFHLDRDYRACNYARSNKVDMGSDRSETFHEFADERTDISTTNTDFDDDDGPRC